MTPVAPPVAVFDFDAFDNLVREFDKNATPGMSDFVSCMAELKDMPAIDNLDVPFMSLPKRLRLLAVALLINMLEQRTDDEIDLEQLTTAIRLMRFSPAADFVVELAGEAPTA